MDSFFFACTVAAIGALILSLILSEKGKAGVKSLGLLEMRTGAEPGYARANAVTQGGKKKQRAKVGESLVRRPPGQISQGQVSPGQIPPGQAPPRPPMPKRP